MAETIHIFIGTHKSEYVPARVLACSILAHTDRDVKIRYLEPRRDFSSLSSKNRPGTRFSFARFEIPEEMNYQGKAIYLDSDMVVFSDIGELWDIPMENYKVLCSTAFERPDGWEEKHRFQTGRQTSVLLLDCSKLSWKLEDIVGQLDHGELTYESLMGSLSILAADEVGETIPFEWNSLETYEPGKTHLLHYTVGHLQPWKNNRNPLKDVWLNAFRDALKAGELESAVLTGSIAKGYTKPSLVKELKGEDVISRSVLTLQYFYNRFRHALLKRIITN